MRACGQCRLCVVVSSLSETNVAIAIVAAHYARATRASASSKWALGVVASCPFCVLACSFCRYSYCEAAHSCDELSGVLASASAVYS